MPTPWTGSTRPGSSAARGASRRSTSAPTTERGSPRSSIWVVSSYLRPATAASARVRRICGSSGPAPSTTRAWASPTASSSTGQRTPITPATWLPGAPFPRGTFRLTTMIGPSGPWSTPGPRGGASRWRSRPRTPTEARDPIRSAEPRTASSPAPRRTRPERGGGTMEGRIANHIRSNIIGYIALFLFAMGGSAYALDGPLPGQNQVGSDDIINGEVKNGDIGTFQVNANSVAPDSLGSAKTAPRSVKNSDLGLGASSSNTIADGGIQAVDVKANTLTGAQIDESTLDATILQRRIGGTCAPGQAIRDVAQNGTVTCEGVGGGGGSSWLLAGNSGTTGADFLGTTDNQPLNLRVNNARGLRIDPASDGTNQSPNVIGGIADNAVTPGVHAATIAGGGRGDAADAASANRVTDNEGTVGGGANN